jgi:hypothetical protein
MLQNLFEIHFEKFFCRFLWLSYADVRQQGFETVESGQNSFTLSLYMEEPVITM